MTDTPPHEASQKHTCTPPPVESLHAIGSIWKCDCGRRWEAGLVQDDHGLRSLRWARKWWPW